MRIRIRLFANRGQFFNMDLHPFQQKGHFEILHPREEMSSWSIEILQKHINGEISM